MWWSASSKFIISSTNGSFVCSEVVSTQNVKRYFEYSRKRAIDPFCKLMVEMKCTAIKCAKVKFQTHKCIKVNRDPTYLSSYCILDPAESQPSIKAQNPNLWHVCSQPGGGGEGFHDQVQMKSLQTLSTPLKGARAAMVFTSAPPLFCILHCIYTQAQFCATRLSIM